MSEQETLKVYELAKELGIDSISLLDKLKSLNIQVKNHMSDLRDEEAQLARSSLKKSAESDKPATKKKSASSSTGATKAATTKTAAKTTTKTAAAKTTATASTTTASRTRKKTDATPAAAPTAQAAESKAASPIIRRRVKADGETETLTPAALLRPPVTETEEEPQYQTEEPQYEEQAEESSSSYLNADQDPVAAAHAEEEAQEAQHEQHAPAAGADASVHAGASTSPSTGTAAPQAPKVREPVVLTPRPVAPRRSILKIVEVAAPPPRPMFKPAPSTVIKPIIPGAKPATTDTPRDGFRIIKMDKANLDQMAEEEAAKKRGVGREAEIRPEDVRFADYRKKEMVFLPKKKKLPTGKQLKKTEITETKAQKRVIDMQENISVQDFANQLSVKAIDIVRKLMQMGQMANINSTLDFDTANLLGAEYKFEVRNVAFNEAAAIGEKTEDTEADLVPRPPVVTIMGHVDHGKTTLLDSIRDANVAGGEAGGITQHIGAYMVEKNGKLISFIDTPGHEAFSVMRARGANVTDIVILVVSADDGVMPQTREALSHAKAAGVPIIVAVNKIDKPNAQPDKIKQGLAELDLLAEDWGGQTMFIPVSALKKTNIDKLLDAILLQAEVLELKANPKVRAAGTVLESRLEKGRGPVVSVLVKRGTLRVGDAVVSGSFAGRVKAMVDDKGANVKELGPGYAAEVLGFEGIPNAGETFDSPPTEADARKVAENRIDKARAKAQAGHKISLEELFSKIQLGDVKDLNLILKADVFGSVEAIRDSLLKLSNEKVKIKILLAAAGGITESDVLLASASNALIIGFNVRPETKARQVAEAEHVQINSYSIIYELIDEVKNSMLGLLDKKKVEKFLGRAEVRQIFSVPKIGVIAGASVVDGKIIRGANVRLLRDSRIIFDGKMSSLRRFKDDAKEVATGFECGIGIENYNDLKPGDIIEAYQIDMIAGTF